MIPFEPKQVPPVDEPTVIVNTAELKRLAAEAKDEAAKLYAENGEAGA